MIMSDGKSVLRVPLDVRRKMLAKTLKQFGPETPIRFFRGSWRPTRSADHGGKGDGFQGSSRNERTPATNSGKEPARIIANLTMHRLLDRSRCHNEQIERFGSRATVVLSACNGNGRSGSKMTRLLLVEDEPLTRKIFGRFLRETGYEVDEAKDGAEAINILRVSQQFDLLVTDIRMPKVDGIAVIQYLRLIAPATPVIVVSAYSAAVAAISNFPKLTIMIKPILIDDLVSEIRLLLGL